MNGCPGFCDADLEDELIRSLGTDAVLQGREKHNYWQGGTRKRLEKARSCLAVAARVSWFSKPILSYRGGDARC